MVRSDCVIAGSVVVYNPIAFHSNVTISNRYANYITSRSKRESLHTIFFILSDALCQIPVNAATSSNQRAGLDARCGVELDIGPA